MDQLSSVDSALSSSKTHTNKPTSMSSFSIESGACGDDCKASTSGCSSLAVNCQKTLKKQRVKRCLEELKSLVKPPKGHAKGGTLTTLQNVITQMKKYRDNGDSKKTAGSLDSELLGSSTEGEGVNWLLSYEHILERGYKVVMSMKESIVLQVPHELLRMLRYPNNYWFNQSLMDYIYKKDLVTVSTNLSMARCQSKQATQTKGQEKSEAEQKNIFFFRIRHYKSIRHGFSLNRSEKYTVFCGRASRRKVQLNFPPGTPVEGLQSDHTYPVLECTPIQSAYTSTRLLPAKRTFLMRHTVHCNFIFLHPSSIPLTGYLPQEVVGTSIFDYYHPQDLLILLGIYQQIVAMPGKTFRSVPYRLRVKNGDYIRLETEWSSYVNPWTNRLDFIICKHHVVEGPNNLDVLAECPASKRQAVEVTPQARSLQKHIRAVLLQQKCRRSAYKRSRNFQQTTESPCMLPTELTPPPQTPSSPATGAEAHESAAPETRKLAKVDEDSELPSNQANLSFLENEKLLIYEQLNYAHNIRRFLTSCSVSQQPKDSSSNDDSELGLIRSSSLHSEATEEEELTVDLSLPKPPSFASSTKALVSEREQLEELMPPSPTHEESQDDPNAKTETEDDVYKPVPLTEEILTLHNKVQRQTYIEKMLRERTNLVSLQGQGLRLVKETGKTKKRQHGKDNEDPTQKAKVSRMEVPPRQSDWSQTDPSQLLFAPVPLEEHKPPGGGEGGGGGVGSAGVVTHPPNLPAMPGPPISAACHSTPSPMPHQIQMQPQAPPQTMNMMTMQTPTFATMNSLTTVGSNIVFCQPMTTTAETMGMGQMAGPRHPAQIVFQSRSSPGMQWPYINPQNFQQPGISYMPQIVYQPIPGSYFPPITARPVLGSAIPVSRPAEATTTTTKESSDLGENSSMGSKGSPEKNAEGKSANKGKSLADSDSPSMEETSSSMMYLLDSGNNSSSPSESEDQLNKNPHPQMNGVPPWRVNIQWNTSVEMGFKLPTPNLQQVLRADRLALQRMRQPTLVTEQCNELLDSSPLAACVLMDDDNLLSSSKIPVEAAPKLTQTCEASTSQPTVEPISDPSASPTRSPAKSEKVVSDSDSSDGAVSKDSSELTPSDLTPSDQRSHDEMPSSNKESDSTSSSETGQLPLDTPSSDDPSTPSGTNLISKVFVPLTFTQVPSESSKTTTPSWLQNTQFNEEVKMNYTSPSYALEEVLETDQQQLENMYQPEQVQDQLDELMVQLKQQVTHALTPVKLGEEVAMSDCSGDWGQTPGSSSYSRGSHSSEDKASSSSSPAEENTAEPNGVSTQAESSGSEDKKEVVEEREKGVDNSVKKLPGQENSNQKGVPSSEGSSQSQQGTDNGWGSEDSGHARSPVSSQTGPERSQIEGIDNASQPPSQTFSVQAEEGETKNHTSPGKSGLTKGLAATEKVPQETTQTSSAAANSSNAQESKQHSFCCSPRMLMSEVGSGKVESSKCESDSLSDSEKSDSQEEKREMIVMMKKLFTSDEEISLMAE